MQACPAENAPQRGFPISFPLHLSAAQGPFAVPVRFVPVSRHGSSLNSESANGSAQTVDVVESGLDWRGLY